MGSRIVLFVSTGRCGTQWLAAGLGDVYGDLMRVEHEPIGPGYRPRRFFRAYQSPARMLSESAISNHVMGVGRSRFYVETGWPLFAAVPLYLELFGAGVRVIHLTRHPVPSALSHLAHQTYAGSPRADGYTKEAALGPEDANVFQPHYAALWDSLTPYEKCLFWWTEVHLYAEELRGRYPGMPLLRIKAEDLFAGDERTLRTLIDFIGAPWRDELLERVERKVDRWPHRTDQDLDPLAILEHEATMRVAEDLGYRAADLDLAALERRYAGQPDPGHDLVS